MQEESSATYQTLFENLKSRGLKNTRLVVSDAHKGLVKAVQTSFIGCSWQRCKVHFMRNILAHYKPFLRFESKNPMFKSRKSRFRGISQSWQF